MGVEGTERTPPEPGAVPAGAQLPGLPSVPGPQALSSAQAESGLQF